MGGGTIWLLADRDEWLEGRWRDSLVNPGSQKRLQDNPRHNSLIGWNLTINVPIKKGAKHIN